MLQQKKSSLIRADASHLLNFKNIKTTERQAESLRIVFKTHVEALCRGVPLVLTQHRLKVQHRLMCMLEL